MPAKTRNSARKAWFICHPLLSSCSSCTYSELFTPPLIPAGIREFRQNLTGMTRFRGFREESGRNPLGIRVIFLIYTHLEGLIHIYIHILLFTPSKFNRLKIGPYKGWGRVGWLEM